ncbi:MAG: hypothetical protein ACU0FH_16785 [Heliomarina sp.]|uniref:hypothetical protein n=1 Tax=Heliomarina sp. TaxID=2917556 RepID=UPI004058865E
MADIKVDPQHVHLDVPGHQTRSWLVWLPAGAVTDDLKDPAIWSKIQNDRQKVLRRHDKLYIVGHDEEFAVEARVIDATRDAAVLALQKIVSTKSRLAPYFADDTYAVKWTPQGFYVQRKQDGMQMGSFFGSEDLAIRHLRNQYPQTVS